MPLSSWEKASVWRTKSYDRHHRVVQEIIIGSQHERASDKAIYIASKDGHRMVCHQLLVTVSLPPPPGLSITSCKPVEAPVGQGASCKRTGLGTCLNEAMFIDDLGVRGLQPVAAGRLPGTPVDHIRLQLSASLLQCIGAGPPIWRCHSVTQDHLMNNGTPMRFTAAGCCNTATTELPLCQTSAMALAGIWAAGISITCFVCLVVVSQGLN